MKRHSVELTNIKIKDSFWSKHVNLVREVIIPYQWEIMNDRIEGAESSHCLENFQIAAGKKTGAFYGAVFQDTDVAKWLEAVGYALSYGRDKALEALADETIDLIVDAQCEDGYINTYFTIKEPERRWKNLCEGHELYTAGHLMEASVAYYKSTGKEKFLEAMLRFADLICDTFGDASGKIHGYPGHQEVEIGLIKLYEITGKRTYLDTAKYFIDARGVGDNYFLWEQNQENYHRIFPEFVNYNPKYSQSHLPVRQQMTAEGHAVRAVYMYCAMADLAYEYQDEELLKSCKRLWDNMTKKRMYVTGSIGSSGILERFTTDYDLPNDYNYSESCASIGLALFGLRMANITKEAHYLDVVERALYNTVLAGIALDGKSFFYVNPLECWPDSCMERTSKEHVKPVRQAWFGVACCPPNIARTLASLGQYIYSVDPEGIYLNLFISNQTKVPRSDGVEAQVEVKTRFPFENQMEVSITGGLGACRFGIRVPAYSKDFQILSHGKRVLYQIEKGYAIIEADLSDTKLFISFEAPASFIRANPLVRADAGKVCMAKEPLVYALEEADNGDCLSSVYVDTTEGISEQWEAELFGGVTTLHAKGYRISRKNWQDKTLYQETNVLLEAIDIKAIPYCYWNNRGVGEMSVWIKEKI